MSERTILQRSGQQWKLYSGTLLIITGVATTARAPNVEPASLSLPLIVGGLALSFVSAAWMVRSVRCPRCSARWLWLAATQDSAGRLLSGQFAPTECSVCRYPNPERTSDRVNR